MVIYLLGFVFILSSISYGSTLVENQEPPLSFHNSLAQNDYEHFQKIFNLTQNPYLASAGDSTKAKESLDVYAFKGKSLKKAFLFSLIIPGSGELYANSKIKALVFFGVDAALWGLYFKYHGKGKDKEKEFRTFADGHWSEDVGYNQWLIDSLGITSDTMRYWNPVEQEWTYLSHHLPDGKTQQYYEMIGKYEQFRWGWDDFSDITKNSVNRSSYVEMRHISNDWLKKAKNSAAISIVNHMLSAFDAAISVRKYNQKGERFSQIELKMRLSERNQEMIPKLTASVRF